MNWNTQVATIKAPTVYSGKQSTKLILINELAYLMGRKGARWVEYTDTVANCKAMAAIHFLPKEPALTAGANDAIVYSRLADGCMQTFATDFKVTASSTPRGNVQRQ